MLHLFRSLDREVQELVDQRYLAVGLLVVFREAYVIPRRLPTLMNLTVTEIHLELSHVMRPLIVPFPACLVIIIDHAGSY